MHNKKLKYYTGNYDQYVKTPNHLIVPAPERREAAPAKWLIKALARGITWYDDLATGRAASFREIAEAEGVDARLISKLVPIAFLDPQLVVDCIDGRNGLLMTGSDVADGLEIPILWTAQGTPGKNPAP